MTFSLAPSPRDLWRVFRLGIFLSLGSPLLAGTWYLAPPSAGGDDNHPGSLAQPFATLSQASLKAQAGDTVLARGGLYSFSKPQSIDCSGTADQWITFGAYPGEQPVFDGGSCAEGEDLVRLTGPYVVFQGFELRNSRRAGLRATGGKGHWHILHNKVHDSWAFGIRAEDSDFRSMADILVDGNEIYRNVQINRDKNKDGGWPSALDMKYVMGATLINNLVHQNYGEGIILQATKNVAVVHNIVHDNYSVNLYLDNASQCSLEGNFVYTDQDSDFYRYRMPALGISNANETYHPSNNPIDGNRILNNIVVGGHFCFYYGNYASGGGMKNYLVANNTFYGGSEGVLKIKNSEGHQNNLFVNNIFYSQSKGVLASVESPAGAFRFDHNAWVGGNPGPVAGPGDVMGDPRFADPQSKDGSGFKPLAGSPCLAAGASVTWIPGDFLGAQRPPDHPDIGAIQALVPIPTQVPQAGSTK